MITGGFGFLRQHQMAVYSSRDVTAGPPSFSASQGSLNRMNFRRSVLRYLPIHAIPSSIFFRPTPASASCSPNWITRRATQGGTGEVSEPRRYQLIRQKSQIIDRTFQIAFLDPGVQALDFTFG